MLEYLKQLLYKNNREVIPLQQRMDNYEINDYCNPENVHIVSLKSKQLLQYINNVYNYNEKIADLTEYNKKLAKICCKRYCDKLPSNQMVVYGDMHYGLGMEIRCTNNFG